MKKEDIIKLLGATTAVEGKSGPSEEFDTVCGCDMMSELLALMNNGEKQNMRAALLTNLNNPQVIRSAEVVDIKLVVLLRGKEPLEETIELSRRCGVSLVVSPLTMYKSCGLLYGEGLRDLLEDENGD